MRTKKKVIGFEGVLVLAGLAIAWLGLTGSTVSAVSSPLVGFLSSAESQSIRGSQASGNCYELQNKTCFNTDTCFAAIPPACAGGDCKKSCSARRSEMYLKPKPNGNQVNLVPPPDGLDCGFYAPGMDCGPLGPFDCVCFPGAPGNMPCPRRWYTLGAACN